MGSRSERHGCVNYWLKNKKKKTQLTEHLFEIPST